MRRRIEAVERPCRVLRRGLSRTPDAIACTIYLAGLRLGESPCWMPAEGRLLCVDIDGGALFSLAPGERTGESRPLEWRATAVALSDRGTAVLAAGTDVFELDLADGGSWMLASIMGDGRPDRVLNDMKCDRAGRLWFGTRHRDRLPGLGSLYHLESGGNPVSVDEGYTVANGIAFAPTGDVLYVADSRRGTVYRYTLRADGTIDGKSVFVSFAEGAPDGLTVDAQGHVWVAIWGGAAIRRFSPAGERVLEIALPCRYPTSCIFGGADLSTLYVTSARSTPDEEFGGAVLALSTGVHGIPETPVKTNAWLNDKN